MLNKLTPEMNSQISEYRNRQIKISKSTHEADWESAREAAMEMISISEINLDPSHEVIFVSSPLEAVRLGNSVSRTRNTLFQSSSYGGTCARNNFFIEVCGIEITDDLNKRRMVLDKFVRSCGGAYFSKEITVIYDHPSVLNISDSNGVGSLHCEDGPAIAWGRDQNGNYSPDAEGGLSLYYWEGTRIPAEWITNKPKTDLEMSKRAAEVLTCGNQEKMRAGCELLGWVPVLESLGMTVLDKDPNPQFGQLVSVDLPDSPNAKFIVAMCGTGRKIAVPADPNSSTAIEAGAKSYGLPVEVYRRLKVRT